MSPTETIERALTLEEFERLSEEDGYRAELIRGRLVREPRPGTEHSWLASELYWHIESYARQHGLGRTVFDAGFLLERDPPTVRIPDIAFIAHESLSTGEGPTGAWTMAPDLVVEMLSPSNTAAEIQEKVLDYLEAGTRLVWVVDPRTRSTTAYRSRKDVEVLTSEDSLNGGDVLPGFDLAISILFAAWP